MKKLKIFEKRETVDLTNQEKQTECIKNTRSIVEVLNIEEQELSYLLNGKGSVSLTTSQLSLLSIEDRQELYNGFMSSEFANSFQTYGNLLIALESK